MNLMFGKKAKQQPVFLEPDETVAARSVTEMRKSEQETIVQEPVQAQTISGTEENLVIESDLTASVSRNTVFTGNIVSQDNVEIFGEVEGSVTSTATVKIHGKVHGDVTCGVLVAGNASITGNIQCEKSAIFGLDTTVNGNINATVVTISGQINGNLCASESVSVSSSGAVYGDIATPEIEVSKGAIVFGSVVMEHPEEEAPPEPEPSTETPPVSSAPEEKPDSAPQDAGSPETSKPEPDAPSSRRNQPAPPKQQGGKDAAPAPDELGPWAAEHKNGKPGKNGKNPFALEDHK